MNLPANFDYLNEVIRDILSDTFVIRSFHYFINGVILLN